MELIVGFNLSSYSHCTSYTRLTTDTGNCCRACGWPFSRGNKKYFANGPLYFTVVATLVKVSQQRFHNWNSNLKTHKNFPVLKTHNTTYYVLLAAY